MPDVTLAEIGAHHIAILLVLDEQGGLLTGEARLRSGLEYIGERRTSPMAFRNWVLHLRDLGFVEPMDDQKPVVWIRTAAGSAFVAKLPAPALSSTGGDRG